MDKWGLRNRIKGLCFDTTASNTVTKGRVCILPEKEIGRELLNLASRHQVSEIMLANVFSIHESMSPNIELLRHFKDFWPHVDQALFSTAMEDESTAMIIA